MPIGPPAPRQRMGVKPVEKRSADHRSWVRGQRCVCAGRECDGPMQAAHFRSATGGGMGLKPHDMWTFPACHGHHLEQHQVGEKEFQRRNGLDLRAICLGYASRSPVKEVRERAAVERAKEAA